MARRFLSLDEASRQLGITKSDLRAMINDGSIRAAQDGSDVWIAAEEIERRTSKVAPEGSSTANPKAPASGNWFRVAVTVMLCWLAVDIVGCYGFLHPPITSAIAELVAGVREGARQASLSPQERDREERDKEEQKRNLDAIGEALEEVASALAPEHACAPPESARAGLLGAGQDSPQITLAELRAAVDSWGQEGARWRLHGRSIADRAIVKSDTELRQTYLGRWFVYDTERAIDAPIGSEIVFTASFTSSRGEDLDLSDFAVVEISRSAGEVASQEAEEDASAKWTELVNGAVEIGESRTVGYISVRVLCATQGIRTLRRSSSVYDYHRMVLQHLPYDGMSVDLPVHVIEMECRNTSNHLAIEPIGSYSAFGSPIEVHAADGAFYYGFPLEGSLDGDLQPGTSRVYRLAVLPAARLQWSEVGVRDGGSVWGVEIYGEPKHGSSCRVRIRVPHGANESSK